jgi:hypothetical protein
MNAIFRTAGKNRRNESVKLGPAVAAVTLCALFAMLGVGYVWYKSQIGTLGRQIKDRELRLAELQRDNRLRRDQLAQLYSPMALDARVRKLGLPLGPPALTQIVNLIDSPNPPAEQRQALTTGTTSNE